MELDILEYWQQNVVKFPELAILARDLLTIPVSAVASESAFSFYKWFTDLEAAMKSELSCHSKIRPTALLSRATEESLLVLRVGECPAVSAAFVFFGTRQ
uniref:HAT C-terminal dimerisation domain-containing protein n=1 Tax=Chenopodium quinoa TaxID=63459 RepID=A0A803N854_CHEQI